MAAGTGLESADADMMAQAEASVAPLAARAPWLMPRVSPATEPPGDVMPSVAVPRARLTGSALRVRMRGAGYRRVRDRAT